MLVEVRVEGTGLRSTVVSSMAVEAESFAVSLWLGACTEDNMWDESG